MENHRIKIPIRFYKEVATHVVANLIAEKQSNGKLNVNIPLLLGIHGKSGQGKTYQIEQTLKRLNFEIFHISGSELESERAGAPAQLIKETYLRAGRHATANRQGVAILIDDVDAGFGMWGDMYQYTVNTQIVIATLMHLADNPQNLEGKKVPRVPIILTGNDFTKIYEPISRPGRMRSFIWEPDEDEKIAILSPIFPLLDVKEMITLITTFPDQPIAFFVNLKASIFQEKIWKLIEGSASTVLENLQRGMTLQLEAHCFLGELLEVGKNIAHNSHFVNHLKKI
jgi:ATP-dependent 26S proteasome regulatory subunit